MNEKGPMSDAQWVGGLLYGVATVFAMQLEILIRRQLGERYFTLLLAYGVTFFLFIVFVFTAVTAEVGALSGSSFSSEIAILWLLVFVVACFVQRFMVFKRKKAGNFSIHSYYAGDSYPFWYQINRLREFEWWDKIPLLKKWNLEVNQDQIQRFFEPGVCALVGILIMNLLHGPFGTYILVCSIAMLFKNQWHHHFWEQKVLDEIDSRIEGQTLGELANGRLDPKDIGRPGKSRGTPFATALANIGMGDQDLRDTASMRVKLSPELQRFTQPPEEVQPVGAEAQGNGAAPAESGSDSE